MSARRFLQNCAAIASSRSTTEEMISDYLESIAYSLAVIAEHIEQEDAKKMKITINGEEIKNDVQV